MYVAYSESCAEALVYTSEWYERGNVIDLDGGKYIVVSRHIHLRRWKYYVRKASWLDIFLAKWNSFWKKVVA